MNDSHGYQEWLTGNALTVGRDIMSPLSLESQVQRVRALLDLCRSHTDPVPAVDHVCAMLGTPSLWSTGHALFDAVRDLSLVEEAAPTQSPYRMLLYVAEIAAQTAYNATRPADPFDTDSPWWIAPTTRSFLKSKGERADLADALWRALCGLSSSTGPPPA